MTFPKMAILRYIENWKRLLAGCIIIVLGIISPFDRSGQVIVLRRISDYGYLSHDSPFMEWNIAMS